MLTGQVASDPEAIHSIVSSGRATTQEEEKTRHINAAAFDATRGCAESVSTSKQVHWQLR